MYRILPQSGSNTELSRIELHWLQGNIIKLLNIVWISILLSSNLYFKFILHQVRIDTK